MAAPLARAGDETSRFGFTGEQADPTGLIHLRARQYDPQTGRFLTTDPFPGFATLPQTLHPYQYALNNPATFTDPSGLIIWDLFDVAFFGWSLYEFIDCPTLANLGWLALDVISLLPLVPSLGLIGKTDNLLSAVRNSARMQDVRALGRAGEAAADIIKNSERIESFTGAAYRIPDVLDHAAIVIGDVKNVAYLRMTNQLRDFYLYSQRYEYVFELYIRESTRLSSELAELVESGEIILKFIHP